MNKLITMMSDWTYLEGAVGACKGVIKSIDAKLDIIDITHEIPAYDIYAASYRLKQVLPYWPSDMVCMVVVDPGVGTQRVGVVALLQNGQLIVTPDNGTLTHIKETIGIKEVRSIDVIHRLSTPHQTNVFHGRDIFAYVSAKLACGQLTFEDIGPLHHDIVCFELIAPTLTQDSVHGMIEILDPNFGNAWTNIPISWFKSLDIDYGQRVVVSITHFETIITFEAIYAPTFGHVAKNEVVVYHNELDMVAIAINQASFIQAYHVFYGKDWHITIRRKHE